MKIIKKIYVYEGENGSIVSSVNLPDINRIEYIQIQADEGKLLTNGIQKGRIFTIRPKLIDQWYEIDAPIEAGQE